ncbi:NAD(P)/FAD-dependent oxidoreductase [Nocardia jiangxiensis]|uniref:NAD(P)/FAD-dependent oxidoreductase n=1 Tax=Nocardia jiangxiensis TaxID=282685 RepID=UPI0002DE9A56|nr:FAD-dependent oxidoreductase [Nocardia jiangxiensis]
MSTTRQIMVVGASVAAAAFIGQLRADGYDGSVVVVERDPDMPYDRPPLSKEFLTASEARPEAPWWTGGCDIVRGVAERVDPANRALTVRKSSGQIDELMADHLVVATGSDPVRLPGQPDGVMSLRTAADARAVRENARPGRRAVVLGAGTVGTELASSLSASGTDVALVDLADRPLDRFFAGHLGDEAAEWIRSGGVQLHLSTRVGEIHRRSTGWVIETDGPTLTEADLVVCAVGTRPALAWLDGLDLDTRDGVACDASGAALTNGGDIVPGLHAIGDAARWTGAEYRREDWTSAQLQGRHLARRLSGLTPLVNPSAERPYFWSRQFGRRIQVLGKPVREATLVTHVQDPEEAAAFYTLEHDGDTVAWISINRPREFALALRGAVAGSRKVT